MIEIVKDFDGSYYANITVDGNFVYGLPENVSYRTLKSAVRKKLGIILPNVDMLEWKTLGRKRFANIT